jgi:hypothetical protein
MAGDTTGLRSRRCSMYTAATPSTNAPAISTDTAVHDSTSTAPPGNASLNGLRCGSRCDADTSMAAENPTAVATWGEAMPGEHRGNCYHLWVPDIRSPVGTGYSVISCPLRILMDQPT